MKIIIGLGNPGEKYKLTRHNVGFRIVDAIAEKYSETSWIKKFNGLYCKCTWENHNFLILKPETFMNNSGQSITSIVSFYKLNPSEILIIHDDLDLKIGELKVKMSGGHAGHNGLKSIHRAIGDKYVRLRIGIGRPNNKNQISSYVLSNFSAAENSLLETYKKTFQSEIGALLNEDYMNLIDSIKTKIHKNLMSNKNQNNKTFYDLAPNEGSENKISNATKLNVIANILKKFS